ncbi:LOW QUALITY PROTEIN: hypothetical protein RJ639_042915 [Escallonia herrerae]|uniref:C2H2-type domain-containing protein n=1 Tax=Escallonia herrerae TaxID=1293975 RepID=A0AA88WDB7_9ASTE|nr:LOW QUALITY PROTEIN: hypothetical protein RJ639_042915 [Escallonia herrerae]
MAAEIGLLSLTQLQKLAQSQQSQGQQPQLSPASAAAAAAGVGSWMWNPKQAARAEDDDSWEVRAFAEDTGNIMGTTWPPRSYTCTFCRREFRSAQALGGHMNVHRRDRARRHQAPPGSNAPTNNGSSAIIIPTQELVANGGLCLLYSIPNPNAIFSPTRDSPSTLLSASQYPTNNLMPSSRESINFPPPTASIHLCHSSNTSTSNEDGNSKKDSSIEEIDLELRLGPS